METDEDYDEVDFWGGESPSDRNRFEARDGFHKELESSDDGEDEDDDEDEGDEDDEDDNMSDDVDGEDGDRMEIFGHI